jgi:aminomuconate-semialdehyde/2-hydroxymuconate-6-semialdehyde dehydrogenase
MHPSVLNNYIDGKFVPPHSNNYLPNFSPHNGEEICQVPSSTSEDVEAAVKSAKAAQLIWKNKSLKERADILGKIANKIEQIEAETSAFSKLESLDTGKPHTLAKNMDIGRVVDNFRYFSTLGQHEKGDSWIVGANSTAAVNYSQRYPMGVVALITPWNLPLYLLSWKLAPALLCGNSVVIKPSELTPLTANLLVEVLDKVFEELSIPKGIVNVCHGFGHLAGDAMVKHPDVKMISFTGGSATGSIVGANAGKSFKRVSLELGGKNTAAIFDDCNFDQTVTTVARSMFLNQGEICLCNSRLLIQDTIYDKFVLALKQKVEELFKPGDPSHPSTTFGALISKQHMEKVLGYIDIALKQGGELVLGTGTRVTWDDNNEHLRNGYFIAPTLIGNVKPTDSLSQEEVFGPVVAMMKFSTEDEAIQIHNNTVYGLAGCLFTTDGARMHRYSQAIETGMIWVNTWLMRNLGSPFGGVKMSGNGAEGGEHSLDCYSYTKNICIKL